MLIGQGIYTGDLLTIVWYHLANISLGFTITIAMTFNVDLLNILLRTLSHFFRTP